MNYGPIIIALIGIFIFASFMPKLGEAKTPKCFVEYIDDKGEKVCVLPGKREVERPERKPRPDVSPNRIMPRR